MGLDISVEFFLLSVVMAGCSATDSCSSADSCWSTTDFQRVIVTRTFLNKEVDFSIVEQFHSSFGLSGHFGPLVSHYSLNAFLLYDFEGPILFELEGWIRA